MTGDEFRELALDLPETSEDSHMGHPDFRVGGKIFATLGPDEDWGMAKLRPQQQAELIRVAKDACRPANGAWGRQGCTIIQLSDVEEELVRRSLREAWRNTASARLSKKYPDL